MSGFWIETLSNVIKFENHLLDADNHRIIFSGPFGSGKTTFLKEFFDNKDNEYEVFHLYPVNYSVANNEDIFELIKYDILFHLLRSDIEFEKIDIPKNVSFGYFLKNNAENIIMSFIRHIPQIGKQLHDVSSALIHLYKEFEIDHENNQTDQRKSVIDYLETINNSKGNEKEEDFYTQLICELMLQVKADNECKKSVLIIDDLDRIDPDHIFRILNVFSAHLDQNQHENKFDFDKIILVCDVNNIRKIYANRYGQDVDFSGYIDKFFTKEVFYFDILQDVENKLSQLFSSIQISNSQEGYNLDRVNSQFDIRFILFIVFAFNRSGFLPIRKLLKFIGKNININDGKIGRKIQRKNLDIENFRFLITYSALKVLFADFSDFKRQLNLISDYGYKNPYSDAKDHYIDLLLPFLTYPDHAFDFESDVKKSGNLKIGGTTIEWELEAIDDVQIRRNSLVIFPTYKIKRGENTLSAKEVNLFRLLKDTINVIEEYNLNWIV